VYVSSNEVFGFPLHKHQMHKVLQAQGWIFSVFFGCSNNKGKQLMIACGDKSSQKSEKQKIVDIIHG